jgi:hypothetical protein
MTQVFDNYEDCRRHVEGIVAPSTCRDKMLALAEWMYSLHGQIPNAPPVRSYATNDPKDIRFYFRTQGGDHFALYKMGKSCAALSVFVGPSTRQALADYIEPQPGNQSWWWIKRPALEQQSIENLQRDIFRAYCTRLESVLGVQTEQCASQMPPPVNTAGTRSDGRVPAYERNSVDLVEYLERAIRAVRLRTGESEVKRDVALDELELQAKRDGVTLTPGWRDRVTEDLRTKK